MNNDFSQDFSQTLEKMWFHRQRQEVSTYMPLFAQAKLAHSDHPELVCFEASLLRAQGELDQSSELLKNLRERNRSMEHHLPRLFMEEGINALYIGDSYRALEKFLATFSLVKNELSQRSLALQSLINAMLCLDNLAQPYDELMQELKRTLRTGEAPHFLRPALETLEFYAHLRKGKLKEISEMEVTPFSQAHLLKLYSRSLPYHRFYHPKEVTEGLKQFLLSSDQLFLKSYRVRTLYGHLYPDDAQVTKLSDVTDRLYLWVWQWLIEPTSAGWGRIVKTIEHLDRIAVKALTADDSEKVACAMGWLGLIDPALEKQLEKFLLKFPLVQLGDHILLHQLERQVIAYLRAKQNQDTILINDYRHALKRHSLYDHEDIWFRYLVEDDLDSESVGEAFDSFRKMISNLITCPVNGQATSLRHHAMTIDLRHYSIRLIDGEKIVSQAMTQAFSLLHRKSSVSDHEFMSEVFGVSDFNPYLHNSRLFSLLWRMKRMTEGALQFKVKDGRVHTDGNWDQIDFLPGPKHLGFMRLVKPNLAGTESESIKLSSPVGKKSDIELLIGQDHLTRQDIELI